MASLKWNPPGLPTKEQAPPGGVEPPTFRLTAERANHCATEADEGVERLASSVGDRLSGSWMQNMHRPGIEPGPPAWQASILPLNHRCRYDSRHDYVTRSDVT